MHSLFFIIFFLQFFFSSPQHLTSSKPLLSPNRRILHEPLVPLDTLPPSEPPKPPPPSPPHSPSASNPKYPFSTTSQQNPSPFFPTFPSPPPPPSPSTFASFPANISSLILPKSPKSKSSSGKLAGVAIAAVACAVIAVGISAFVYCRRRRKRYSADEKTVRSHSSLRLFPPNVETTNGSRKVRHTSSTSSEFLYLGTIVDSRGIEDRCDSRDNDGGGGGVGGGAGAALDPRKMASPDLQPLPPLARQASRQQNEGARDDVGSTTVDEEDEEFYSPRGSSLGGRESSIGTGSGSRRVLSAIAAENFVGRSSESSSSSFSSSASRSPDRSHSISLSPPASLRPQRAQPKSPETAVVHLPQPLPPPALQPQNETPVGDARTSLSSSAPSSPERNQVLSPALSSVQNQYVQSSSMSSSSSTPERAFGIGTQSPLLSSLSLSPNRASGKCPDGAVRASSYPISSSPEANFAKIAHASPEKNELLSSPRLSNASSKRVSEKNEDASPRLSNASNGSSKSLSSSSAFSLPSSPDKAMLHSLDQSPRISNFSDGFRQSAMSSMPFSPTLFSSPERELNDASNQSATVVNDVFQYVESSDSTPPTQRKHWEIPVLSTPIVQSASLESVLDQIVESTTPSMPHRKQWEIPVLSTPIGPSVRVSPRPPTPPPPAPPPLPPASGSSLQRQRKQWEVPAPSTPVGQPISKPPELILPSGPFVLQKPTTKVSPVELPPSSQNLGVIEEETSKPKLKPLHWDKVRASSDRQMVWDQLRSSSFKLNEEMIESLFVVNTTNTKPKDTTPRSVLPPPSQEDRILDPRKSQNIAILLRALNVTVEEVCEALLEGSADLLGAELLESLLKMAPSKEEERKLKEHKDDSPTKLGPAEKFLKVVLDVPFAFRKVEAMLYVVNFESEVEYLRKSFQTLEAACEELRNSRMFLKLLEAVLKTGNRMNVGTNRGDAHAFKLDTLLKLVDVKGADGKTTLLHFVVQEIIRTEGARLSRTNQTSSATMSEDAKCRRIGLQVVSNLSSELANVKKAAAMDSEVLSSELSKLSKGIANISEVVQVNEKPGSDESTQKFTESMNKFMRMAAEEILIVQAQESVALSLVKEITEYFHGNLAKEEAHPFRIFMVVRDFLTVLDRVCKEVGMINERTIVSSAHKFPVPVNPMLPQPLPRLHGRRQCNSSDDDSPSP